MTAASSDGSTSEATFTVAVGAAEVEDLTAATPFVEVQDAVGPQDRTIPLSIAAALTDTAGSETLRVLITGVPDGASLSDGSRSAEPTSDGVVDVTDWDLGQLRLNPPAGRVGRFELTFEATATEAASGDTATETRSLSVSVTATETSPPTLKAALARDTGVASDGVTSDPTVAGVASGGSDVTLKAAFGDGSFADLTNEVGDDGWFSLDRSELEAVVGGPLADGAHVLTLIAKDGGGEQTVQLNFSLDTGTENPTVRLAAGSDTGAAGDGTTTAGRVTLEGTAEAFATVRLVGTGLETAADAEGAYSLSGVSLVHGSNTLLLEAEDVAGNSAQTELTIERTQALPRLFVTTDMQMISGVNHVNGDKDDVLSLVHTLLHQDKIDIVGLASSTSKHQPGANDRRFIDHVIDRYGEDYAALAPHGEFKTAEELHAITYQGHEEVGVVLRRPSRQSFGALASPHIT